VKRSPPRVLALDLEGTLISSAVSQFPRPGLRDFLAWALGAFERVVVFTSVRAEVARTVMATLVEYGDAPAAFADIEIVAWQGKVKDLGYVRDATPSEVLLVDDQERVIDPTQRDRWIAVAEWDDPAVTGDRELERVRAVLEAMRSATT
jgi:hypothetical protein